MDYWERKKSSTETIVMKLWKQMSVFAHCSCFVLSVSMISSEMTRMTITEIILKLSIRLFWKASSSFGGLFCNTQCQLKLLSAFEFWASLTADVIFAQDQIISLFAERKKHSKKMKIDGMFRNGIVIFCSEQIHMLELGEMIWKLSKKHHQKKSYWSNPEMCVKMCCQCRSRNDVCCVHQTN